MAVPLYEYQCKACGHRFEKIQKFSDEPLKTCPKCGKDEAERLISAPAVQFKGEGWYGTDYAKKNSSQGSSGKVEASSTEKKSESKTETKSDTSTKKD